MMRSNNGLSFGLSLTRREFVKGQPITMHLWVDNPTDQPVGVMTCMDLDYFRYHGYDIYDASGIASLSDQGALFLRAERALGRTNF